MESGSTWSGTRWRPRWEWEPIRPAKSLCSYWLKLAEKSVSGRFARELKEFGIIASEWAAIRELYRPGRLSPVDIAGVLGMTKGGASKLVDRLVKKRLVIKRTGEYDRRFRTVELTKRGEDLVPHLAALAKSTDRQMFGKFVQRRSLMDALKRVVRALGKEPVDIWHVVRSMTSLRRARANARGWATAFTQPAQGPGYSSG
jgi:DNA-binding MarR family transcriptional regulator